MTRLRRPALLLGVLLVTAALTSCSSDPVVEEKEGSVGGQTTVDFDFVPAEDTARVRIEFTDASVPPPVHRSWVLMVDRQEISLVVDSYGEVVGEKTAAMPPALWREFRTDLPAQLASLPDTDSDKQCPGGTAVAIRVEDAGEFIDQERSFAEGCADSEDPAETPLERIMRLVEPMTEEVDLTRLTAVDVD